MENTIHHPESEVDAPKARYHCDLCHRVTLAPLGQTSTVCRSCGKRIEGTRRAISMYAEVVAQHHTCPARFGLTMTTDAMLRGF